MRLRKYLKEQNSGIKTHRTGSFVTQGRLPEKGQKVWFLKGFDREIVAGTVVNPHNKDASFPHPIDPKVSFKQYEYLWNAGLDNNYTDIEDMDGNVHHIDINDVYDHEPNSHQTDDDMDWLEFE